MRRAKGSLPTGAQNRSVWPVSAARLASSVSITTSPSSRRVRIRDLPVWAALLSNSAAAKASVALLQFNDWLDEFP
jgi:hypothetical protein